MDNQEDKNEVGLIEELEQDAAILDEIVEYIDTYQLTREQLEADAEFIDQLLEEDEEEGGQAAINYLEKQLQNFLHQALVGGTNEEQG